MIRTRSFSTLPLLVLAVAACSNSDMTVTPPPGGLSVTYTPCPPPGYWQPFLVAVRDGTGPWRTLTASGGSYTTTLDSTRVQLLRVLGSGGDDQVELVYALATEVKQYLAGSCPSPDYTASGTVNNLAAGEEAMVSAGWSGTAVVGPGNKSFSTEAIGTTDDLLAVLYPTANQVSKMILRRGIAYTAVAPIDFTTNEAFAVQTPALTVTGTGSDAVTFAEWYLTPGGFRNEIVYGSASTTLPTTYWAVPAAKQAAGDLHELYLYTTVTAGAVTTVRVVDDYFHDPVARTVAFGAVPAAPTITWGATTPYARLRAQFQLPAGHQYLELYYYSVAGSNDKNVNFYVSAGYLGGSSVDLTVPDLTDVSGWSNSWMPLAGVSTNWGLSEWYWASNDAVFAAPRDGLSTQYNGWRSTIAP